METELMFSYIYTWYGMGIITLGVLILVYIQFLQFYFISNTTSADAKVSSAAEGNILEAINLAVNGRHTGYLHGASYLD